MGFLAFSEPLLYTALIHKCNTQPFLPRWAFTCARDVFVVSQSLVFFVGLGLGFKLGFDLDLDLNNTKTLCLLQIYVCMYVSATSFAPTHATNEINPVQYSTGRSPFPSLSNEAKRSVFNQPTCDSCMAKSKMRTQEDCIATLHIEIMGFLDVESGVCMYICMYV
jgi:hypothetical protein